MSYKTILVHVNSARRLRDIVKPAIELAASHGAHLTALSIVPPIVLPQTSEFAVAIPSVMDAHRDAYKAEERAMKAAFEELVAAQPAGRFTAEWKSLDAFNLSTALEAILPLARASDLIVAGQSDRTWDLSPMLDWADTLATESGRPALIIPLTANRPFASGRIMLAWNGRRESTRAAFDALPLLKRASEVKIAWLAAKDDGTHPAAALQEALARHGVKCSELAVVPLKHSVGETLLSEAAAQSCDVLVMGCYGHSRIREFILGGTSRYILSHATIPVLMSH